MTTTAPKPETATPPRVQRALTSQFRWGWPSWGIVHAVSLLGAAAVLVNANKNQWFYFDEWTWIVRRGPADQTIGLFTPHNEHWSTIPVLIWKALLATVGLGSYLPYVGVVILLHLALAHLLWRASIRVGARPAIATAVAAVFALLGAGFENLLWAFQMGFVGSVLFGWLAVMLHDHDGRFGRRDVAGWAASIVALMWSGPAVLMVAVAGLTVALRRRRLVDAGLTVAGPLVAFGVWYVVAGHEADSQMAGDRWRVVDFAWSGLTHTAETVIGIPRSGALVILALLFWWVRHLDVAVGRAALAAAGMVGALGFYLLTGSGRGGMGLESASASRYLYIAVALLLPGAALILSRVLPVSGMSTGFVFVLCALVIVHNFSILRTNAGDEMGTEQALKRQVEAGQRLLQDGEPVLDGSLASTFAPDLNGAALRRLDGYGWLPSGRTDPLDDLNARLAWQVAVMESGEELGEVTVSAGAVEPHGSCAVVRPSGGHQVSVTSAQAEWRVQLSWQGGVDAVPLGVQLSDGNLTTEKRGSSLLKDRPRYLESVAVGRTVILTIPAVGTTTLCADSLQLL